jgi:hypothetical protein
LGEACKDGEVAVEFGLQDGNTPPHTGAGAAAPYRTKVERLAAALNAPDTVAEAAEILRGLIDHIVLTPVSDVKPLKRKWRRCA